MNRKGAKNAKFSLIFVSLCALCVLAVKNNAHSHNNIRGTIQPGLVNGLLAKNEKTALDRTAGSG